MSEKKSSSLLNRSSRAAQWPTEEDRMGTVSRIYESDKCAQMATVGDQWPCHLYSLIRWLRWVDVGHLLLFVHSRLKFCT